MNFARVVVGRKIFSNSCKAFFSTTIKNHQRRISYNGKVLCCLGVVIIVNFYGKSICGAEIDENGVAFMEDQTIINWSSTHGCRPHRLFEPVNAQEVCRVLRTAHDNKQKVRPVGTALSPNGIALSGDNLISLSAIDYVEVDVAKHTVTVGAGARVSDVLKELSKYGMTLENFSSIQEQQMGGWTQVAAHGTSCTLPTVEEMIVRMKLATPTEGLLTLSASSNAKLFSMAKVGLGALGVVTELTLKCVPKFKLKETTIAIPLDKISEGHNDRLSNYRHVRYMWLPYTSKVICVVSNPVTEQPSSEVVTATKNGSKESPATKPLYELLLTVNPSFDRAKAESLSFSQLRDLLVDHAPLDTTHIKRVNQAEAQYWEATIVNVADRVDAVTNILGFDCGGEQLVYEVCFPIGSLEKGGSGKDIAFVKKLLKIIESKQLPAPCPIEQRWSSSSTSPMSPAYAPSASATSNEVFAWVGVIMYLPPNQIASQRADIKVKFNQYVEAMQPLLEEYNAHAHWAKIELPEPDTPESIIAQNNAPKTLGFLSSILGKEEVPLTQKEKLTRLQKRIATRYNVTEYNNYRKVLDPRGVLSNDMIDGLFGKVNEK